MAARGDILFVSRTGELVFSRPVRIIAATRLEEVIPCLHRVDAIVARGFYAAGFVAYEAAPAFDAALCAHPPGDLPLVWFGIYKAPRRIRRLPGGAPGMGTAGRADRLMTDSGRVPFKIGPWRSLVNARTYRRQVGRIRKLIVAGDIYQANYTFPLQASFEGDSLGWFRQLCGAQQSDYSAFIQAGRFHLLSVSPELFFRKQATRLITRPMKGTARRGRWLAEDRLAASALAASPKERSENVMIVDVLRNDMGRVSRIGSVDVKKLCAVEQYPTVWQMTSTIVSRCAASVPGILAALFPSGSVTGAPKIRATEIIRELEPYPRGVYCGTVGWWAPGGEAEFNVAIRTVTLDTATGAARYHVGGGITHGSLPDMEYAECLAKAEVLTQRPPDFDLLESLRWEGRYFLLREHLDRLAASAAYFGFPFNRRAVATALRRYTLPLKVRHAGPGKAGVRKVRLLLRHDGSWRITAAPLAPARPLSVGLSAMPVDESQKWLYHKTTQRDVYRQALLSRPDCADVILWNRRGELTESTIANLVLELDGALWTPPVRCGLLAGTFRRHLLATGRVRERVLHRSDLRRAVAIRLINSVRRWIDVQWMG